MGDMPSPIDLIVSDHLGSNYIAQSSETPTLHVIAETHL